MEEIPSSKRRKIEETVVNILKNSDLETATEHSVRAAAAQQLGADLSDLPHKCLVRQVLESFLLSTATYEEPAAAKDPPLFLNPGRVICKLSDKRNVAVHDFNGKALVSLRDYYEKDGKQFPSARGISLTGRQWSLFRSNFPAIEEAIAKMESQIRLATAAKQSAADFLHPAGDTGTWGTLAFDGNQMEAKTSSSVDAIDPTKQNGEKELVGTMNDPTTVSNGRQPPQAELLQANSADLMNPLGDKVADVNHPVTTVGSRGRTSNQGHKPQADTFISPACTPLGYMPHNSNASFPQGLVPIMTTRLDGKNYHCWVHLMEFFLNQIKVAYVLKDPCPSISVEGRSSEEIILAKAAVRKWVDDEYICRHYILNSLCDSLFNQYSRKVYSARELWEELRSVYQEEFGTLRSQVNKYIQFQMVDGVPVLEQVQELNRILNGIMASGIWVDENFHVSVIISKLPPSWKDYRAKLMLEEVLPCNVMMHHLKLEEESRNQCAKGSMGRNSEVQSWEVKKKSSSGGNKKDMMKGPCYNCGKEGHVCKYCPDKEARKPRENERKGE